MMLHATPVRSRAGFTLIEILAVLLILSILVTFLVRQVGSGQKAMQVESTRALLTQIGGMIDEYYDEMGAYPPSTFPSDLDPRPTALNMGSESLVIALWKRGRAWQAREVEEEMLGNTDGDATATSLTTYTKSDAFELRDLWENPIAYIQKKDYGKEFAYLTLDASGEALEASVRAHVSRKTGDPFRKDSFQLLSAGPDGEFGTGDDIGNFDDREDE